MLLDVGLAWSPDGTRIAFASRRHGGAYEIYTIHPDGTNLVRLTHDDSGNSSPVWSPDGTRIAFVSSRDGNQEIYAMDADGSNQINLTNDPGDDRSPAWSPYPD